MKYLEIKEMFGTRLFDSKKMKERLPANVWEKLSCAMNGNEVLDSATADVVASAMKEWAVSMGATHWTHWFHPLTGMTAEKHTAFINLDENCSPFDSFNGRNLTQSEPDASSFPSGGMRSTFEARGYSAWDTSSPAFIMSTRKGGTLCIPSFFLSYDGTPLDVKTVLLKSLDAIETRIVKLLHLFGQESVKAAHVAVGVEQEFFLVDKELCLTRPDLMFCRRTIIGAPFPKDQTLEAHYFASIPSRIMKYMEDVERDLVRVGIIIEAKHNEVAPGQYEFCVKFTKANLACDQNQLLMDIMKKVAEKHDFELLLHEKPFAGVNGSGKHTNISLSDDNGNNLLQLRETFAENLVPLSFIAALTLGVAEYHSLLNSIIATYGNTLRIGAHEAPPNIISVYLGEALEALFKSGADGNWEQPTEKIYKNFGVKKIPNLQIYTSDRNRTSPLAFCGNKFEFRAPGSSQAVARPVTMLTAIWSWGIDKIIEKIESNRKNNMNQRDSIIKAIAEASGEGKNICFEGDAYTESWRREAKARNLAIPEDILESIDYLLDKKNVDMLSSMNIFSKPELEAYRKVRLTTLCNTISTEMEVLREMMFGSVLPAISKQIILEGETLEFIPNSDKNSALHKIIVQLGNIKSSIIENLEKLDECGKNIAAATSLEEKSAIYVRKVVPIMNEIRRESDMAEIRIDKGSYPFATYGELLGNC
jgi:glutamine synthetase